MTQEERADLKELEIKLLKYLNWAENGIYEEPKRTDYSGGTIREALDQEKRIRSREKVMNVYPPVFDEFIGKKVKEACFAQAELNEDGDYSLPVSRTVGDPLRVHFRSDGTIVAFSGGGEYVTRERNGETVTEYCFFDLDRSCVRDEIRAVVMMK